MSHDVQLLNAIPKSNPSLLSGSEVIHDGIKAPVASNADEDPATDLHEHQARNEENTAHQVAS